MNGFLLSCAQLLDKIPATFWGVVIGSLLTLTGIFFTNRANNRRLSLQLQHDRELKNREPNHTFEVPVAIIDSNGNLQVMAAVKAPDGSTISDFGCWNILTRHLGDSPDGPMTPSQKLEHLGVRGPIEQTWNDGNSTAYWLEVTNRNTAKTIRNVRAEVVKIEPPQTHLNWPVPLVVKHSQGKLVRDSTSLNAGQPGGFDLVSAHKGGPISVLHTVPDTNTILHQGSVFRLTVAVTGEDASPVTKQFDVWQDAEGFLRCTPA